MSDEIRNALLEEFPELPDREVILMQLKGDLIDALSGLTPVEAHAAGAATAAEPEPDVAGEALAEESLAASEAEGVAEEVAAEAPAEEPLAPSEAEGVAEEALAPSEVEAPAEEPLAPSEAEGVAEEAAESAPVDGRAQTLQMFVDDLNLQQAAGGDEAEAASKRGQTQQFFIDDLDLSKRSDE